MAENEEGKPRLIHIRVLGDQLVVEDLATRISTFLAQEGFEVLEQTRMFPARYSEGEGKVYVSVR